LIVYIQLCMNIIHATRVRFFLVYYNDVSVFCSLKSCILISHVPRSRKDRWQELKISKKIMEDPLLLGDNQIITGSLKPTPTWRMNFTAELKNLSRMALPMATVTVAQYLLPVISVMVAGHRSELQLSGVALATSFTNVSGFSVMVTTN